MESKPFELTMEQEFALQRNRSALDNVACTEKNLKEMTDLVMEMQRHIFLKENIIKDLISRLVQTGSL